MAIIATHTVHGAAFPGAYIRLDTATLKKVEDDKGRRLVGVAQFTVHEHPAKEVPFAYVDVPAIDYVAGADLAALAYDALKALYPDAEDA